MPSAPQTEVKPSKVSNLRELLKKPTAENTSVASAPQSQQGTAPVIPAPTLPPATPQVPISSAPVGPSSQPEADETQIASQYDSVMSQAVAQGFQEQVVTPQPEYQSASSTFFTSTS